MGKEISLEEVFAKERAKRDAKPLPSVEAMRITDRMNMNLLNNPDRVGHWCAFRLDNGNTDGVIYDEKRDCIKYQGNNEAQFLYVMIRPDLYNAYEVQRVLEVTRNAYAAGVRTTLDGGAYL